MATSSHLAKILVRQYDLTAKLTNGTAAGTFEMLDSTTLADAAKRSTAGLRDSTFSVEGWHDAEVVTTYGVINLFDSLGIRSPFTYAPAGLSVGAPCVLVDGWHMSYEHGTQVNGLASFTIGIQSDAPVGHGFSLHALTAETSDGNGTSYDRGVTSTAGGAVAHIHTTAFSGLTNNIVTIEDSANNTDFSVIGTFTTITAVGGERINISGTVRRYVRAVTNVTGSGSTTFAVAFAPL